jgi:hypothetical protein
MQSYQDKARQNRLAALRSLDRRDRRPFNLLG